MQDVVKGVIHDIVKDVVNDVVAGVMAEGGIDMLHDIVNSIRYDIGHVVIHDDMKRRFHVAPNDVANDVGTTSLKTSSTTSVMTFNAPESAPHVVSATGGVAGASLSTESQSFSSCSRARLHPSVRIIGSTE